MLHVSQTYRIPSLKDSHKGQRCFVVGNGPSLNGMDLRCLSNEFVIATNYAFLKEGINTKYLCISDMHRMWELLHHLDDVVDKLIFYNSHVVPTTRISDIPPELIDNVVVWQAVKNGIGMSFDLRDPLYCNMEMGSVVFPAIQIAAYMGATDVYLIGVDQDYSGSKLWFHDKKGVPHREIGHHGTAEVIGHDYQYSYERQFKPGIEYMHQLMRDRGLGLFNAGVGGKLDAIPRVEFNSLFGERG